MDKRPRNLRCSVLANPDALLIYDLRAGVIDSNLTDYARWLVTETRAIKLPRAHGQILNLMAFCDFLTVRRIELRNVSDREIEVFRNEEVVRVVERKTSKGSEHSAKLTVDIKILDIYRWLLWMQSTGRVPPNTIGPVQCRVQCGVSSVHEFRRRQQNRESSLVPMFPLLFNRRGGSTMRHKAKAKISREKFELLVENFMDSSQSVYLRRRNALIADIGAELGLRRDSICSLETGQFRIRVLMDAGEDLPSTVSICPPRQKRNYANWFEMPAWLAVEIQSFIDGPRQELLVKLGLVGKDGGCIFLSERTGKPLQPRSVTKIFSMASRAIGLPPGTSVHSLRRMFARECVDDEIAMRIERGMTTDTESVCRAVALRMGQADWQSLTHYVSDVNLAVARQASLRDDRVRAKAISDELEKLREENRLLRRSLEGRGTLG